MFQDFLRAGKQVVLQCPKCSSYHVVRLEAGAGHSRTAGLFPPLGQCPGGACCQTPLFFRVFPLKQFPCLCVHCILGLFAVPELQRSVQQGSSSHSRRQHRHWSLCTLQSVFVCSARNAVVSSERVKLTPSSPARALVTVCIAFCVWLQCLKCSGQFSKAQAHTVVPLEGIPRTGSSKDFKSMADIGGEDVGSKVTGWLVGL